jgi:hypothetical protein
LEEGKNYQSEVTGMRNRLAKVVLLAMLFQALAGCGIMKAWAEETARPDELWERAVAIAAVNQRLVPGNVHIRIEEANGKGKIKKLEESWVRFYPDENNMVKSKLLKHLEKGKDHTEQRQKADDKKEGKKKVQYKMDMSDLSMAFQSGIQPNITVKRLKQTENMDNRRCVVYEYQIASAKEGIISGRAWLGETGIPVAVKYAVKSFPKKQNKFIKEATHEIHYQYRSDNCWYPQKASFQIKIKAVFWEWNVKCDSTFSDFWQYSGKTGNHCGG